MATSVTSTTERGELWERLAILGRVLKLQQIAIWTVRLLMLGLAIDCLWLMGSRFLPYVVPTTLLPAIPLALAGLGALVLTFWRPSLTRLALLADRQLDLKERLTTAVELQSGGESRVAGGGAGTLGARLAGMQLRDAIEQFRRVEPMDVFPIRVSLREVNATLVLAVLAVALVVWPNPMTQTVRQREQVQQAIKQEAERLTKQAEQLAGMNAEEQNAELQQIEQALREGAKALEERSANGEEALAALAALEQRLQALQGQGGTDLEEALSSLAGSLAQDPNTRALGTSLAKGDYEQAAEELRKLGEQIDSMSQEERSRLARSLRQAGQRSARSDSGVGQSLSQAANAVEQGSPNDPRGAMNNAAQQIERASSQLRTGSERERAASQLQQSRSAISRSVQQQRQAQARSQGQGQGQGQGQNGAQAPGAQGAGQPQAGGEDGASGQGQPGSEGNPSAGDQPGGSGAGTGSNPRSEEIYDPSFASSNQEFVESGRPFEPTDAQVNPNPEGAYQNDANVSYRQVHARYQEKAVQSLQNSYIPVGMKDLVKDYFSSLTPGE